MGHDGLLGGRKLPSRLADCVNVLKESNTAKSQLSLLPAAAIAVSKYFVYSSPISHDDPNSFSSSRETRERH